MKVTKEKAAENRASLVNTAARLFRERGIDGVGVAEISKQAGLTHGALYAQFPSKEALAAEAFSASAQEGWERVETNRDGGPAALADLLDYYMSLEHRDNLASSCPMSASASEIGRQDRVVSARFTEGFEKLASLLQLRAGTSLGKGEHRPRALTMAAAMIGGVAAARAVAKADSKLSNEILRSVRQVVGELGGEDLGVRTRTRARKKRAHGSRVRVRTA